MSEALEHENDLNEVITKPEDRVPLTQKIAFGFGLVSDHLATVCLFMFMFPFFNDWLKISATALGAVMGAFRLWDAFTDPFVGNLSDKCKSRFGRRKPFLFVGAILTGICFPLIWMVPEGWSDTATITYLSVALLLFYTSYTIFSVPYEALGTELTPDYKERTNIFVVRTYVKEPFNIVINWAMPLATWLALMPAINSNIVGVRIVSVGIGVLIMIFGIIPATKCVERYREIAKKQESEHFVSALLSLRHNKPFLMLVGIISTYLLAIFCAMAMAYYVNTYYIYGGIIHKGAVLGAIDATMRILFALFGAWWIKKLSNKYDKNKMLQGCVLLLIFAFSCNYFTHIPGRPWLTLLMKPFIAIGEVGFWVLVYSMKADICDWDEFQASRRREGTLNSASNWIVKLTISLALVLGGVLLEHVVRFDSKLDDPVVAKIEAQAKVDYEAVSESARAGKKADHVLLVRVIKAFPVDTSDNSLWQRICRAAGDGDVPPVTVDSLTNDMKQQAIMDKQSPATMKRLLICYIFPPVVALIIAFVILSKYPLTQKRLKELRAQLEERRGETISS